MMSANASKVLRWMRWDHLRNPEPVPVFVARWRRAHILNLSPGDLEEIRNTLGKWDGK
jgi:hypothetical protein